jgi:tetratricopeptide (TPR) repeat protein
MNPSAGEKSWRGILYGRLGDDDDSDVNKRIAAFTRDKLPLINLKGDLKAQHIYLEYQLHRIDRILRAGAPPTLSQDLKHLLKWAERIDDPMTCLAVAQFFRARGMIDESLKWVDLAAEADPYSYEQKDLYVNLGTIYRQAGDLGMAGQALSKALQIDPEYTPARYNAYLVAAETSLQKQDWQVALEAFHNLIDMEPGNPLHHFNLAVIYERLPGRVAAALDHYRKFISLAGQDHSAAVTRARERINKLESSAAEGD